MKKILSTVLALVMVLATFTMLVPTASAAESRAQKTWSWDFEDASLEGLNLTNIEEKLGWQLKTPNVLVDEVETHGFASVEAVSGGSALRLKRDAWTGTNNSDANSLALQLCQDGSLAAGFTIEYDFYYPESSAGDFSTTYNADNETNCGEFVGNSLNGGDAGTWHVQLQMKGTQRNGIRSNTWNANTSGNWTTDTETRGKWYSAKIVMESESGMTIYTKAQSAAEWTQVSSYESDFTSYTEDGVIQFMVRRRIDIMIDNVKVTANAEYPAAYGVQAGTITQNNTPVNSVRLIGLIDNDVFTKADEIGFRVTMTKTGVDPVTQDIFCDYVYSSITQWGTDTKLTPSAMKTGASHIYALHIYGMNADVTIDFTPIYKVGNDIFYGAAASTVTYTAATNTVALAQ
ncbi:MAG: hypothetical protein IJY47_05960 [Clostridia bacterium]|nr:hypothetical protein [Clostridia bacterium]